MVLTVGCFGVFSGWLVWAGVRAVMAAPGVGLSCSEMLSQGPVSCSEPGQSARPTLT